MTAEKAVTVATQTVGVIGSGTQEHDESAREVGELLADLGVNLLTGGGRGVMRAASRAFVARRRGPGLCIGIIPSASEGERGVPKPGYPNEFIDLAIYTHLPYSGDQGTHDLSRNHINVLSSSVIVALPGDAGTISEALLALRYGKPIVAFALVLDRVKNLPAQVPRVPSIELLRAFLLRNLAK